LSKFYNFTFNYSFCLEFRVFLPSFAKERRKMLAKRRKKDRGSTERLAENPRVTRYASSDFGMVGFAKFQPYTITAKKMVQ